MARSLRIGFAGAIYQAMSRGNAWRKSFRGERDYGRFWERLEATIDKFRCELFEFVWMPTHMHRFFRTREPNLARGMQYLFPAMPTGSARVGAAQDTYF